MLPALPKTFGKLSDVFISALGSITGKGNRLAFRRVDRASVFLIDGLGVTNLKQSAGHAPFLNQHLRTSEPLHAGFPATTASSIASFATGLSAAKHGILGYSVYDQQTESVKNLLTGWGETQDPLRWQPNPTVAELAALEGVPSFVVGPPTYANTGFTSATMRGANYIGAASVAERFEAVAKLHREHQRFICYAYVPELDQLAHARGWKSTLWLNALEELDAEFRTLSNRLGERDGLLVTADHGVVDVPSANHIFLDELDVQWPVDLKVAGDPRVVYIYCELSAIEVLKSQITSAIGDFVWVATGEELESLGWFGGEVSQHARATLPNLVLISRKPVALYHRGFASPKSLKMVGQHGSVTADELRVPLIKLAGYGRP